MWRNPKAEESNVLMVLIERILCNVYKTRQADIGLFSS